AQEVTMKRLLAMAAMLLASSAAQAQYQFEYGGHTIRLDPGRGTVSLPVVYDNTGRKSKRAKGEESQHSKSATHDAKVDPQAAPAAPAPVPAPAPAETAAAPSAPPSPAPVPAATAATAPEPTTATANNAPA